MTGHAVFGDVVRILGSGQLLTTGMYRQFLTQKARFSSTVIYWLWSKLLSLYKAECS